MQKNFDIDFTVPQLRMLASIVQVGNAVYNELMENDKSVFSHRYFSGTKSRIRTKLVHVQCQIESKSSEFPFQFRERTFAYDDTIPELRTDNCILHFAKSKSPDSLPYPSGYKKELSQNNMMIRKQLVLDFDDMPKTKEEPFYGLVVFGGKKENPFIVIQFPEPGFTRIAKKIIIPQIISGGLEEKEDFRRKKAVLKEEYLVQLNKEAELK